MSAREKPILFTTEMVRAILGGHKTQTRRIVKPQPIYALYDEPSWRAGPNDMLVDDCGHQLKCPYGKPGDLLWVRETWAALSFSYDEQDNVDDWCNIDPKIIKEEGRNKWHDLVYRADDYWLHYDEAYVKDRGFAWRPSIYMPRWASRITLEVLRVRVERLQEISQADARAEGVDPVLKDAGAQAPGGYWYEEPDYVEAFANLWDSIHSKPKPRNKDPRTGARNICFVSYPWAEEYTCKDKDGLPWYVIGNPWVWVVEFKRVE